MLDACWNRAKQLDTNAVLYECVSPYNQSFVQSVFGSPKKETILLYCTADGTVSKPYNKFGDHWQGNDIECNSVQITIHQAESLLVEQGHASDWDLVTFRRMQNMEVTNEPCYIFEWFGELSVSVNTTTQQVSVLNG
jgi:hypothetical protein